MDEKRYDLIMPDGCLSCHPSSAVAKVTIEQAQFLHIAIEKIKIEAGVEELESHPKGELRRPLPGFKDIIGLYVDDVESVPTAADYATGHKASGITVGDTVKMLRKPKDHEGGWGLSWVPEMDALLGQMFVVDEEDERYGFHVPGGWLPFSVLEKVAGPPWTPKVGDWVILVRVNLRAEVLATWGEIAWLNLNGNALTYGFDELRSVPPEPEKREWRDGDIVQSEQGIIIFIHGKPFWIDAGPSDLTSEDFALTDFTYRGNLLDLLDGGEIVFTLSEGLAHDLQSAIRGDSNYAPLRGRLNDALAAYRKRKGK